MPVPGARPVARLDDPSSVVLQRGTETDGRMVGVETRSSGDRSTGLIRTHGSEAPWIVDPDVVADDRLLGFVAR